jgi:hypothetical protein
MSQTDVTRLSLDEAIRHEPLIAEWAATADSCSRRGTSVALEAIGQQLPSLVKATDGSCCVLLAGLPAVTARELELLAHSEPSLCNVTSADLRTCRPFLTFHGARLSVSFDLWRMRLFLRGNSNGFLLGFAADNRLVLCRHRYSRNEMEVLRAGVQGQCASSGPNFNPWRIYSAEEMEAAAGRTEAMSDSELVIDEYWLHASELPARRWP